ncbi:MAG: hypothetical protein ACLFQH_00670 [Halothiobacillaceae bacterium]
MQGIHLTKLGNDRVLLEPHHGVNPASPDDGMDRILTALQASRARNVYYDLAQVTLVDPVYYHFLNQLAAGCHALGMTLTCINMAPQAAFALAAHMEQPPRFQSALTLEDAP